MKPPVFSLEAVEADDRETFRKFPQRNALEVEEAVNPNIFQEFTRYVEAVEVEEAVHHKRYI